MHWVACRQLLQLGGQIVFVEKIFKRTQLLAYRVIDSDLSLRLLREGVLEQRKLSLATRQTVSQAA
jgi:hypothetical protein